MENIKELNPKAEQPKEMKSYDGKAIKVLEPGVVYALPIVSVLPTGGLVDSEQDVIIPFVKAERKVNNTRILAALLDGGEVKWSSSIQNAEGEEEITFYPITAENIIKVPVHKFEGKYVLDIPNGQPIEINPEVLVNDKDELIFNVENPEAELPEVAYVGAMTSEETIDAQDGVTTRAMLVTLIYNTKVNHKAVPCKETAMAITKMEEALLWLDARHVDREARGVLGTSQK